MAELFFASKRRFRILVILVFARLAKAREDSDHGLDLYLCSLHISLKQMAKAFSPFLAR